MLQELPENMLHTRSDDETQADLEDPMEEDVVLLRVVPPAVDDKVASPAAK
ncbi:UNVERIFIED_CONTAM: hypothetical protein Sradi_4422300 [Sesamum radiatum]|uniref:Uncharacterized protein n=1 Tax=Sesamum radiatum TaxID=300843 RepID=A0AAW2NSL6_SESRA